MCIGIQQTRRARFKTNQSKTMQKKRVQAPKEVLQQLCPQILGEQPVFQQFQKLLNRKLPHISLNWGELMLPDMHTISKYFLVNFLYTSAWLFAILIKKMHEYYSRNFKIWNPTKGETSPFLRNQEKLENPNLALVCGAAFCTLHCHSTCCSPALSKN